MQTAQPDARGIRFGYWMPVFGGWLRNVADENMEASWPYLKKLAQRSEQIGFDLTLIAELNLNDIKGPDAPCLDAWSTAAALAAVTERLEIMIAVRPTFHLPAVLAKQAANIDHISSGRLSLNLVASWWATEARQYGANFDRHDQRYERAEEWLEVVDGLWQHSTFSYSGDHFQIEEAKMEPKPVSQPRPTIYAGGESPTGKSLIARQADGYLTHGDAPALIAERVAVMKELRRETGLPSLIFGAAGYVVCKASEEESQRKLARITDVQQNERSFASYRDWVANTQLEDALSLQDYSVSNRGLRAGLVGTPEQVADRVIEFKEAGLDLLLLQFSPQLEEMEYFAREVIPLVREKEAQISV